MYMPIDPELTPTKVDELATMTFSFPRLNPDSPEGCPRSIANVSEYAAAEVGDDNLQFVGTYNVGILADCKGVFTDDTTKGNHAKSSDTS